MYKYKVSFIMGIYNCESTLKQCLESIINQTYNNWELVICDDASTDNSYDIAVDFSKKYSNVTVLKNNANLKLAATLNRCLEVARGEYIARIDADDSCFSDRIEKQVKFLDNNQEYALVGGWAELFDEKGIKGIRKTTEDPKAITMRFGSPFIHPSIMMRKSTYESLGGYTVSKRTEKGQDTDLWFRFFHAGYKAYNIQEPLIRYHESLEDYKKRGIKTSFLRALNHYHGFRLLGFPKRYYFLLLKPIISALIPNKIMYWYHSKMGDNK